MKVVLRPTPIAVAQFPLPGVVVQSVPVQALAEKFLDPIDTLGTTTLSHRNVSDPSAPKPVGLVE